MRIYLKSDKEYEQAYIEAFSDEREKELKAARKSCVSQLASYEKTIKDPKKISEKIYEDVLETSLKWVNDKQIYDKCADLTAAMDAALKKLGKKYRVSLSQVDSIEQEIDEKISKKHPRNRWIQTEKNYVTQLKAAAALTSFVAQMNAINVAGNVDPLIDFFETHLSESKNGKGSEGYSFDEEQDILKDLKKRAVALTTQARNTPNASKFHELSAAISNRLKDVIADKKNA